MTIHPCGIRSLRSRHNLKAIPFAISRPTKNITQTLTTPNTILQPQRQTSTPLLPQQPLNSPRLLRSHLLPHLLHALPLLAQEPAQHLAELTHPVSRVGRIRPRLAQRLDAPAQADLLRPWLVLVPPRVGAHAEHGVGAVRGWQGRGLDAGQFGGEVGVYLEDALERAAVFEEVAVGVVLCGVGLAGVWGGGGWLGFWRVGRVVLFVLLVAGHGAAVDGSGGQFWYPGGGLSDGMTYYGSEHRGHLYFPGCVPHTPQSLGSGFFRGGDGSASGSCFRSVARSAARAAVGSGETAPSMADCWAEISLSAAGITTVLLLSVCLGSMPFCNRSMAHQVFKKSIVLPGAGRLDVE